MSLILKKIELSNIRSHQYVNFEPSENGITALSGPNGSGKSTIFDSIAWALYGTKPQGVSRAAAIIRHGTDLSKEKCYAKIWLQLGDTIMRVERKIVSKTGSVECEIWEKGAGQSEYTLQAGPSVSHAEPYIKKRLKMDEKGFLAAVLVQQKQVDQLISAGAKERAEVIEKLTGISSITAALTEARQQHNSVKKTLKNYDFDENALKNLEEQEAKIREELAKKTAKRDELKEKGIAVDAELKESIAKLRREEEIANQLEEARSDVAALKATIEALQGELQRTSAMKDEKKKSLDSFSAGVDLQKFSQELNEKRTNLRRGEARVQHLNDEMARLRDEISTSKAISEKTKIESAEKAQENLEKIASRLGDGDNIMRQLREEIAAAKGNIATIESAIDVISAGNGSCPTCLQHVDNVTAAVESLHGEAQNLLKKSRSAEEQLNKAQENHDKLSENQRKMAAVLEALQRAQGADEKIVEMNSEAGTIGAANTALEKEVETLEKSYAKAKMAADIKGEYDILLASAKEISDQVEAKRALLNGKEEMIKGSKSLGAAALASLRKKTQELSERRNESIVKFSEIKEECSLLASDLKYTLEGVEAASKEADKYSELMRSVEASGNTVAVLEEFREERINNSVPIVSAYASDLLSRFTDGKFTQLKLDKKFNTTVALANGVERSVGLLSGGELSSAAIALRLAISLLLNSGSANTMLGLDEVLVSQDAERSELILTTIRDLFQGQLIIISHGPNTNEIADRVITL